MAGQQAEQHGAEGVQVRLRSGDAAGDDLGGDERDAAQDQAGLGECGLRAGGGAGQPCDAQVDQHAAAVAGKHEVGGLYITVGDTGSVRGGQGRGALLAVADHALDAQRALIGEQSFQGGPG